MSETTRVIASFRESFFFPPPAKEKFADRQALVYMRVVDYKKKNLFSSRRTSRRTGLQYLADARGDRVRSFAGYANTSTLRDVIIIIINLNRSRDQYRHNYAR